MSIELCFNYLIIVLNCDLLHYKQHLNKIRQTNEQNKVFHFETQKISMLVNYDSTDTTCASILIDKIIN